MSALRRRSAAARPRIDVSYGNATRLALATARSAAAGPPDPRQSLETRLQGWRVIVRVFLPFSSVYFLSYLFRSINALISPDLSAEFGLNAADMGLLTSVYFLTFAALQVPIGIGLDRYGPRRVEGTLLLFAVAGALLFSMSNGFVALTLGRALVGVGVAAAFTGGLKAIALWFPRDRIATMNGYQITIGALGALSATSPARLLLDWTGSWRGLFMILAAVTVICALTIWFVVPEAASSNTPAKPQAQASLKTIYGDLRFWQLAPLSAMCAGSVWALQSLWAAPWFADVEGLPQAGIALHLLVMPATVSIAAPLLGMAVDRLRRRGIGPQVPLGIVATMVITAQVALILRWPVPSWLSWSILAVGGSVTVLSYTIPNFTLMAV